MTPNATSLEKLEHLGTPPTKKGLMEGKSVGNIWLGDAALRSLSPLKSCHFRRELVNARLICV